MSMPSKLETELNDYDLITGVLAAVARKGIRIIPDRADLICEAFEKLMPDIQRETKKYGIKSRVRIITNRSGLSGVVLDEIHGIHGLLLHTEIPPQNMYLDMSDSIADSLLKTRPGKPEMYHALAESFLSYLK